jgi:hypothetical protein
VADIEIRCFGWRFLWALNKTEPATSEPDGRDHTAGSFEPAWVERADTVTLGFRPPRRAASHPEAAR